MKAIHVALLLVSAVFLLVSGSDIIAGDKGKGVPQSGLRSISGEQPVQPQYSVNGQQVMCIYRQVVAGGGGSGTSASFDLDCTVAQPASGCGNSASYLLSHGFWQVAGGGAGEPCDCEPGDPNGDLLTNVGDAVYIINYIFKGGPPPTPYAICSGDANGDCAVNVGDAVYQINYIFKGGPAPVTCDQWRATCGTIRAE